MNERSFLTLVPCYLGRIGETSHGFYTRQKFKVWRVLLWMSDLYGFVPVTLVSVTFLVTSPCYQLFSLVNPYIYSS